VGPKAGRLTVARPAFYAARPGGWRDWWTLLHPPYTAWHLSYVVIGATLAPHTDAGRLGATVLAFFFAVGIAAHAFDELQGRPLGTRIPTAWLIGAGAGGLVLACGIGAAGVATVGFGLLVFIALGPLLVLGYNLELFGGRMHTDLAFAAAWGAFPVLVGYFAQAERLDLTAALSAAAALGFSLAQRALSTPARALRRRVTSVDGSITMYDGTTRDLEVRLLLHPLERALGSMSWAIVALALALVVARVL
jgi:hypothetical protein